VILRDPGQQSHGGRHLIFPLLLGFRIEKQTAKRRTTAAITPVEGEARVEEIARMGAGLEITEAARAHARELLAASREKGPKKKPARRT